MLAGLTKSSKLISGKLSIEMGEKTLDFSVLVVVEVVVVVEVEVVVVVVKKFVDGSMFCSLSCSACTISCWMKAISSSSEAVRDGGSGVWGVKFGVTERGNRGGGVAGRLLISVTAPLNEVEFSLLLAMESFDCGGGGAGRGAEMVWIKEDVTVFSAGITLIKVSVV